MTQHFQEKLAIQIVSRIARFRRREVNLDKISYLSHKTRETVISTSVKNTPNSRAKEEAQKLYKKAGKGSQTA